MSTKELDALMRINFLSIDINKLKELKKYIHSWSDMIQLHESEVKQFGINAKKWNMLKYIDQCMVDEQFRLLENSEFNIINIFSNNYPALLKQSINPPLLLYTRGNIDYLHLPQVAVVGSRKATPYGLYSAQYFSSELARSGFVITSGLALGVDAQAHQTALSLNQPTIAVLGSGLSCIYPRAHQKLAEHIAKEGLIISEFISNTSPKAFHFPKRNRIIAGLSLGTLVVEAGMHSGSLITARLCNEIGRPVFCVPGSIRGQQNTGCHHMIRQGAVLVRDIQDILEELPAMQYLARGADLPDTKEKLDFNELGADYKRLLSMIDIAPMSFECLYKSSGLEKVRLAQMLSELELSEKIKITPGGYCRI